MIKAGFKAFSITYTALACLMLLGAPAYAQLAGSDTAAGASCAGFPTGATRLSADADSDGNMVTLICNGTTWEQEGLVAISKSGNAPLADSSTIYYHSGGKALIDILEDSGITIDAVTISATNNKWPDYINCYDNGGTSVRPLPLWRYGDSAGDVSYGDTTQYYNFLKNGTYDTRADMDANCGASSDDIDTICTELGCGFIGSDSSGGGGGGLWFSSGSDIYYASGKVGIGTANPYGFADLTVTAEGYTPSNWRGATYNYGYTWGSSADYNGVFGAAGEAETAATGAGMTEAYGVVGSAFGTNDATQQYLTGVVGSTVTHDTDVGYALRAQDNDSSTGGTAYGLYIRMDDADITTKYGVYQYTSNWNYFAGTIGIGDTTPDVALDVVGDINYTGVLVDVSDMRMKYDIKPLDRPLNKLTTLNGFSFKMKDDEKKTVEYGVSAQEVQKVFPELVHQIDNDGTLGVSYNGLIPPMIEALKEQQAQIDALKAEIEALKAERNNLNKPDEL